jgi:hypothetical protein
MTDDNDGKAADSGVRCTLTAAPNDKRRVRPRTDHFKRLLEEACPNHAYPVRYKFKDCGMMRSFMTSGSITWGAELDEGLDESDTTLFLEENTVTTVYGVCPPLGRHRASSLSPRAPTRCGWGHGGSGVLWHKLSIIIIIYIY